MDAPSAIKIAPAELAALDTALREHPAVSACRIDAGERLVAYIVPRSEYLAALASGAAAALDPAHIARWQARYDEIYSRPAPFADPTFNTTGWNDNHTGEPLAEDQMREWLRHTVERILALQPKRLLEIGCGTGLLLFRLAPHLDHYRGTDFSRRVLTELRARLAAMRPALPQVELLQRSADDFSGIATATFDTVVLNSVVQYFPSISYLLAVLRGAIRSLSPGGHIFIGDVRSLSLLELFYTTLLLRHAPPDLSADLLRQQIRAAIDREAELAIDPAFFLALPQLLPEVGAVSVQLKRGRYHNELTRYRYDVVLTIGPTPAPATAYLALDWLADALTLPALRATLAAHPPLLVVKDVPNARLSAEVHALQLLTKADDTTLESALDDGVDPEDLWLLGVELHYKVALRPPASEALNCFDAVFTLDSSAATSPAFVLSSGANSPQKPLNDYANNPLREVAARRLAHELHRYLQTRLPDQPIPSAFAVVETLAASDK